MDYVGAFATYLKYEAGRSALTIRAYLDDITLLAKFVTGGNPDEFDSLGVTTADLRAWLASMAKAKSAATLSRHLQSIRAFYRFMQKKGHRPDNPAQDIPSVKIGRHLPFFVKESEMEEVLESHTEEAASANALENPSDKITHLRDSLIIELLYATGMRQAELLALNDADISFPRAEVRLTGKRAKQRVIPLPPQLLEKIREWQNARDAEWGEQYDDTGNKPLIATSEGRISKSTLYRTVRRMLADTSAGRKSPHTLRHTFATAMLNGGSDIHDVKEFLGHSSLATTQIYTHVSMAQIREAYAKAHPRAEGGER